MLPAPVRGGRQPRTCAGVRVAKGPAAGDGASTALPIDRFDRRGRKSVIEVRRAANRRCHTRAYGGARPPASEAGGGSMESAPRRYSALGGRPSFVGRAAERGAGGRGRGGMYLAGTAPLNRSNAQVRACLWSRRGTPEHCHLAPADSLMPHPPPSVVGSQCRGHPACCAAARPLPKRNNGASATDRFPWAVTAPISRADAAASDQRQHRSAASAAVTRPRVSTASHAPVGTLNWRAVDAALLLTPITSI